MDLAIIEERDGAKERCALNHAPIMENNVSVLKYATARARKLAWRLMGPPQQTTIDTITPRRTMIDNAVVIVQHNTRGELKRSKVLENDNTLMGDYLEFGVYQGGTFIHAYKRAANLMPFMRFWAFDSFSGLPELTGPDIGGEFHAGQFSCDQRSFETNLRNSGIEMSRVEVVPGWFDATLTPELKKARGLKVASIVYIDADLYSSTICVLNFLTDLLTTGSVVMFDDWFCFRGDPGKGVQRAWSEWLGRNKQFSAQEFHLFGAYGKSFIMHLNSSEATANAGD